MEIFPATGFPDRLWNQPHGGDPIEDAFLRSSRGVAELYSAALGRLNVKARGSLIRILSAGTQPAETSGDDLEVFVIHDRSMQNARVSIPYSVGRHDELSRARLALTVIHAATTHLAELQGWSTREFESCARDVEESAYEFTWAGSWKSNPGRTYEARTAFRLPATDGFGRAWLEVRARGTADVFRSPEATAFCTSAGFERAARTLRWADRSTVGFAPYSGLLGASPTDGGVTARLTGAEWTFERLGDVAVRRPAEHGIGPSGASTHEREPRVILTCC